MAEKVYVVVALHNTGHGEVGTPLIVTGDLVLAVRTARDAEKLGYKFFDTETGVVVHRLEPGRAYTKAEHRGFIGQTDADMPCVFVRRLSLWQDGVRKIHWDEEWISVEAEAEYRRRTSPASGPDFTTTGC